MIFRFVPRPFHRPVFDCLQYHLQYQGLVTYVACWTEHTSIAYCTCTRPKTVQWVGTTREQIASERWEEGLGTRLRDLVTSFQIGFLLMVHQISFVWTPCAFFTLWPGHLSLVWGTKVWSYNHRYVGPCLRRERAARRGTNCHRIDLTVLVYILRTNLWSLLQPFRGDRSRLASRRTWSRLPHPSQRTVIAYRKIT